jgi:hypothetical protein
MRAAARSRLGVMGAGTALAVVGLGAGATAAGAKATSAPPIQRARLVALFPSDRQTVRDASQLTGRRVALPLPNCTRRPTDCNTVRLLDQLDGFDIDPRLALTFDRAVDPAAVAAAMSITADADGRSGARIGVDRIVYDPSTHSVYAHPARQLAPSSRYTLRVRGTGQNHLPTAAATFTTESATSGLLAMRRQLDSGAAYRAAGMPADSRGLRAEQSFPAAGTTLSYTEDLGSGKTAKVSVLNTSGSGAGRYVFGSYLAPSWLTRDTVIPQTSTRGAGPQVQGKAQLPFVLIVPAGPKPAGGWPVAIFGHGFTRSDADLFLAADFNASRGVATIATDVVGHGYGPLSTWNVTSGGKTTSFSAHARGVDADGNGTITSVEGVSAPVQPSPLAAVGDRDGLRETVADLMALVRAIGRGGDLGPGGTGAAAATGGTGGTGGTGPLLRPTGVTYYGQSFGGIYGVMLGGTDPLIPALVPNVSGGPVSEIARLSPSFRLLVTQDLAGRKPTLLNGGYDMFTESMPLRGDAPVTAPARGALAIQQALADETWIQRSGSPETFAPLLRATPPVGSQPKRVLFQNAFGDQTVPNPTNYTVLAAGRLFDRENLYRNDRSPQAAKNPHGFLLDPSFVDGSLPGQQQVVAFLASGGRTVIDPNTFAPDGADTCGRRPSPIRRCCCT